MYIKYEKDKIIKNRQNIGVLISNQSWISLQIIPCYIGCEPKFSILIILVIIVSITLFLHKFCIKVFWYLDKLIIGQCLDLNL